MNGSVLNGGGGMSERGAGFRKKNKSFILDMLGLRCLLDPEGKIAK